MFCQSHYSMALFLHLFDVSTRETVTYIRTEPIKPLTSDVYLGLTRRTSTFLALIGQVCDMVEAIASALRANHIRVPIAKFMTERNQAIHAARIPMGMNYAGLYFARIALKDNVPGYRNRIAWGAVDAREYKYAEDWFEETRRDLIRTIADGVLPIVKQNCQKEFTSPKTTTSSFDLFTSTSRESSTYYAPISGAMSPPSTFA